MAVLATHKPGYSEYFHFSRSDQQRFVLAHSIHKEYELCNEAPMAAGSDFSHLSHHQLRGTTLSVIAVAPYDQSALAFCSRAFESLEGVRKSDILFIVEHPLAIIPDDCEAAFPDRIARAIGTGAGLRVVDPQTSLASTEIVERAIRVAAAQGRSAEEVLGAVVNSVALALNIWCHSNVLQGIDTVAKVLGEKTDLLGLYQHVNRMLSYSAPQARELGAILDQAAVDAGIVDEFGEARKGSLYERESLLAILGEIPHRAGEVLGLAALAAAGAQPISDTIRAMPVCYEAWGGRFSALQLHRGTLAVAKHPTATTSSFDRSPPYIVQDISLVLNDIRAEAVNRCVELVVPNSDAPRRIVVVADRITAPEFSHAIVEKLG